MYLLGWLVGHVILFIFGWLSDCSLEDSWPKELSPKEYALLFLA
jgi:hypothetical protein